jgi:hypothetical protein
MDTSRPRRGARLCRRCALEWRGETPHPRQIVHATKCEKLHVVRLRCSQPLSSTCAWVSSERFDPGPPLPLALTSYSSPANSLVFTGAAIAWPSSRAHRTSADTTRGRHHCSSRRPVLCYLIPRHGQRHATALPDVFPLRKAAGGGSRHARGAWTPTPLESPLWPDRRASVCVTLPIPSSLFYLWANQSHTGALPGKHLRPHSPPAARLFTAGGPTATPGAAGR